MLNFEVMRGNGIWNQFRGGLGVYASSFTFLREHGLWHGFLVTFLGAFATMKLVGWVLDQSAEWLQLWLSAWVQQQFSNSDMAASNDLLNWLFQGLNQGVDWLLFLLTFWIQFKVTKFLVLVVLSPVYAVYAELVAKKAGFNRTGSGAMIWSVVRGLKSAVLVVALEIVCSMLLLVVFGLLPMVFPGMALFTWWCLPVVSTVLSIWFYGAALLDFAWELKGLGARHSLRRSVNNTGMALALGIPFFVSMAIPALGWLVGPLLGGFMGVSSAVLCVRHHS